MRLGGARVIKSGHPEKVKRQKSVMSWEHLLDKTHCCKCTHSALFRQPDVATFPESAASLGCVERE